MALPLQFGGKDDFTVFLVILIGRAHGRRSVILHDVLDRLSARLYQFDPSLLIGLQSITFLLGAQREVSLENEGFCT